MNVNTEAPVLAPEDEKAVDDVLRISEYFTAEQLKNAVRVIDGQFDEGYAIKNPALVSAVLENNQANMALILQRSAPVNLL